MNYLEKKKKALMNYVSAQPTPPIPSEYQQVEWIGNDSTAYLIIDTNLVPTDRIDTEFAMGQQGTDKYMICLIPWNSPSNTRYGFGSHGNYYAMPFGSAFGSENRLIPNTIVDYDFHTWYYENGYAEITDLNIDKTLVGIFSSSGANQKFRIFYGYNSVTKGKIKSFIQKRNGEEIVNLIPCYRKSDNEIGMYDTVTQTFYTNSGTGTFTKGQDV